MIKLRTVQELTDVEVNKHFQGGERLCITQNVVLISRLLLWYGSMVDTT
jgi:hypothetical protein